LSIIIFVKVLFEHCSYVLLYNITYIYIDAYAYSSLALIQKAEPFDPNDIDPLGVFHGSELIMVFDFEEVCLDHLSSTIIIKYHQISIYDVF
jgi:hypothetical protein